jgi:DNA-binding MarR family transcriptional regulator
MAGTVPKRQHAVKERGRAAVKDGGSAAVKDRGPAADAFSALVVQVLKLAGALEEAGNELSRPAGQSSARWQVLAAVEEQPLSVAAVARALAHTRQSVQRVADLLVADDLARYTPNPAHRRAKLLELTPAGLAALRTIQAAQAAWAVRVAEGLRPAELDAARATLAEIERRLETSAG